MIEDENELHLNQEYHAQVDRHVQGDPQVQVDPHTHDHDRLPWLEAVEPDHDLEQHNRRRVTNLLVAGVGALTLLLGGLWYLSSQTPPIKAGDGSNVIAAADGDYKTKPADAGGMKVDAKGDSVAATAQGAGADGKIDPNAKPEAPITPAAGAKPEAKPEAAKPNATAKIADVRDVTPKAAPATVAPAAAAAGAAAGTGMIQLGAYGSKSSAEHGWAELKAKYDYLAALPETITQASVGGGTVYRLRASAGTAAAETCAKLNAAGSHCIIAH